jgi:subtilisin family serine protease
MKKLLVVLSSIALLQNIHAQVLSAKLQHRMNAATPSAMFDVQIVFGEQNNNRLLGNQLRSNLIPVSQRAGIVQLALKERAKVSQDAFLSILEQANIYENDFQIKRRYYIVNMITAHCNVEALQAMAQFSGIEWIGLIDELQLSRHEPVAKIPANERSVGGHEPGHDAIAAPFMWNLGYTGLGTRLYTVDTGIWTVHPAVSRQYRGNYLPESACWLGFDFEHPADKPDAHGTHVTGTVLGLDTANSDTIGIAFNATYMATDPIVEDIADVRPLEVILAAFEFALNPDGDTLTDDAPHVICNSWGFGDTLVDGICTNSIVTSLFDALDAAGIAVEFSAGNEGPGTGTTGLPAYIVLDSINVFSVGALNANVEGYPIADFSSRGPSVCGGDSLNIKPEVSAPGVNIRSSVQQDQYALYQGTSMAGPHVAGAVLLLKEAFPMLEGRIILNALYKSAIDLGEPGEDNTYGNGIINLEAAFNYLSQSYTPVPPNPSEFDPAVAEIIAPAIGCSGSYPVQVVLANNGNVSFGGGYIHVKVNNGPEQLQVYAGTLEPGERDTVSSVPITLLPGYNEIIARFEPLIDLAERELLNNSRVFRTTTQASVTLPFAESFEFNDLEGNNLILINGDNQVAWDTTHTAGIEGSNYSGFFKFLGNTRRDPSDFFYTPFIAIPQNLDSLMFQFSYAYKYRSPSQTDSIRIEYTDDCGATWNTVFYKGGQTLASFDTTWVNFKPFAPQHWKQFKINLRDSLSGPNVMFRFQAICDIGSNFFIDNIFLYENESPFGMPPTRSNTMKLYPNPAQSLIRIELPQSTTGNVGIKILDIQGRTVIKTKMDADAVTVPLNIQHLNAGYYTVVVESADEILTAKLAVIR